MKALLKLLQTAGIILGEELFRIASESLNPEPPKVNDWTREGKLKPKAHVYDSSRSQDVRLIMAS